MMYGPIGTAHRNNDPMEPLPFNIHNSPSTIREALLAWYDRHQRVLPWRAARGEAPDPYRVWLSEVMLQQTRVETVRGYYERWLERFPTLDTLAAAPLDEVLRAWEGLGYYSRARNLHRAVREVAVRYGGRVPDEPEAFRALPGVGRYTAGAVMSIAFGRRSRSSTATCGACSPGWPTTRTRRSRSSGASRRRWSRAIGRAT
jgi:adenine-specific DNA glycosylase